MFQRRSKRTPFGASRVIVPSEYSDTMEYAFDLLSEDASRVAKRTLYRSGSVGVIFSGSGPNKCKIERKSALELIAKLKAAGVPATEIRRWDNVGVVMNDREKA